MDEQHTNPEGFDPAPEQHEASPFEQYVPVPPAPPEPPVMQVAPVEAIPVAETEIPAVGAMSKRGFLSRPWKGEEKLWKVFWLYGVVGAIVLQTLIAALAGIGGLIMVIPGLIVMLAFAVWNIVSVWRCAWNANAKFWGYVVRVLCVLSAISYASTVFALLTSPGNGPVTPIATHEAAAPIIAPTAPVAAPSTAPSPAAPVAAAPIAPAVVPHYSPCEKQMADFATQNGADPKAYIAQNQAWLAQCNQAGGAH